MNYFFAVVVAQLPSCREKREELSNSRASGIGCFHVCSHSHGVNGPQAVFCWNGSYCPCCPLWNSGLLWRSHVRAEPSSAGRGASTAVYEQPTMTNVCDWEHDIFMMAHWKMSEVFFFIRHIRKERTRWWWWMCLFLFGTYYLIPQNL